MSRVHDAGGGRGPGPVRPEADEPVFHHEWERRTFALALASGFLGRWNLDMSRHARERMPAYWEASYYERWLWGLEVLLGRNGWVTRGEIEARLRDPRSPHETTPPAGQRVLTGAEVHEALRRSGTARLEVDVPPRFKPGERVRARTPNPAGHTRLPGYCGGRQGVVESDRGVWVFPDTHAAGEGKRPQHVYGVRFAARELWGPGASPLDSVYVDLWDDYLDPASCPI